MELGGLGGSGWSWVELGVWFSNTLSLNAFLKKDQLKVYFELNSNLFARCD